MHTKICLILIESQGKTVDKVELNIPNGYVFRSNYGYFFIDGNNDKIIKYENSDFVNSWLIVSIWLLLTTGLGVASVFVYRRKDFR